jgi:hypothetical protein
VGVVLLPQFRVRIWVAKHRAFSTGPGHIEALLEESSHGKVNVSQFPHYRGSVLLAGRPLVSAGAQKDAGQHRRNRERSERAMIAHQKVTITDVERLEFLWLPDGRAPTPTDPVSLKLSF